MGLNGLRIGSENRVSNGVFRDHELAVVPRTSLNVCLFILAHSCIYFLPGAFEIEINGQLVFSKLENGGFPYEKDVSI